MTTLVLRRLLWKDARTLLPIWGALLIAVVSLQALMLVFALYDPSERWFDGRGFSWSVVTSVAAPLAFCFAAAAAAILFAGESEEGTDDWLRVLPIPPRTLATAKLATGLASLLLFVLATALTGALATWIGPNDFGARGGLVNLAGTSFVGLAAFATGIPFSLQFKRVVAVLGATLMATLPLMALADWFANDVVNIPNFAAAPMLFATIGLVDIWLVYRWSRGEAVALPRPVEWLEAAAARLTAGREFSLRCLKRASSLGSPRARMYAVQFWREMRSAFWFVAAWTVGGAIFLLPTLFAGSRSFPVEALGLFAMLYWLATPAVCGLMTAAGDQRTRQHLFLGQHGVSPATTWIAKQLVWVTVAIALIGGWGWTQHTLAQVDDGQVVQHGRSQFTRSYVESMTDSVHVPSQSRGGPTTPEDLALRQRLMVALMLSLFAVGQLCSFWFRNSIVASAVAIFCAGPTALWLLVLVTWDIPLWMGAGPLIVLWLAATWRLADDWQCDRVSRAVRWSKVRWLALPCLAALVSASIARRTQIPSVEIHPLILREKGVENLVLGDDGSVVFSEAADTSLVDDWDQLQAALQAASITDWNHETAIDLLDRQVPRDLPAAWIRDAERLPECDRMLAALADRLRRSPYPHVSPWSDYSHEDRQTLVGYVLRRGWLLHNAGESLAEWRLYVDTLTLLRTIDTDPLWGTSGLYRRRLMFHRMANWLSYRRASANELRELLQSPEFRLETSFELWNSPHHMALTLRNMLLEMQSLDAEMLLRSWRETRRPPAFHEIVLLGSWRFLEQVAGETERSDRLARHFVNEADRIVLDRQYSPRPQAPTLDQLDRWEATTGPFVPTGTRIEQVSASHGLGDYYDVSRLELACERGLKLLMALEIYRGEQGEYPRSLSNLVPDVLGELPSNPFTGTDFAYLPDGLPAAWLLRCRNVKDNLIWQQNPQEMTLNEIQDKLRFPLRIIPAEQPIVWTPRTAEGGFTYRAFGDEGLYREVRHGFIEGTSEPFPFESIPALRRVRAIDDGPATFVVLGMHFPPWGCAPADE